MYDNYMGIIKKCKKKKNINTRQVHRDTTHASIRRIFYHDLYDNTCELLPTVVALYRKYRKFALSSEERVKWAKMYINSDTKVVLAKPYFSRQIFAPKNWPIYTTYDRQYCRQLLCLIFLSAEIQPASLGMIFKQ